MRSSYQLRQLGRRAGRQAQRRPIGIGGVGVQKYGRDGRVVNKPRKKLEAQSQKEARSQSSQSVMREAFIFSWETT
jgi:hypothetical protein